MLRVVLPLACALQGASDHGGDHRQSEAFLAVCRYRSPGMTSTFIGCEQEGPLDTGESHRTEKSASYVFSSADAQLLCAAAAAARRCCTHAVSASFRSGSSSRR